MSYASLAAPTLPMFDLPTSAIAKAGTLALQSLGFAVAMWTLLAIPAFLG